MLHHFHRAQKVDALYNLGFFSKLILYSFFKVRDMQHEAACLNVLQKTCCGCAWIQNRPGSLHVCFQSLVTQKQHSYWTDDQRQELPLRLSTSMKGVKPLCTLGILQILLPLLGRGNVRALSEANATTWGGLPQKFSFESRVSVS